MTTLRIEIACGETTCASERGKFCQFLGSSHFGQRPECCLFPHERGTHTPLQEKDGWVQRCEDCLKASK